MTESGETVVVRLDAVRVEGLRRRAPIVGRGLPQTVLAVIDDYLSTDRRPASSKPTATVRALRSVLAHVPVEVATKALTEEFPWLGALPPDEAAKFVDEFLEIARTSAVVRQESVLADLLRGLEIPFEARPRRC